MEWYRMYSSCSRRMEGVSSVLTPSGTQNMAVLSEQGLYFFLGRSDITAALAFQKWVAGEVLPSIRKSGAYRATPKTYLEALETLVESEKEKQRLQEENAAMKPKAESYDRRIDRELLTNFRNTIEELYLRETVAMKKEVWNGREIRFVEQDGQWWAVAQDIAEALALENVRVELSRMPEAYVTKCYISSECYKGKSGQCKGQEVNVLSIWGKVPADILEVRNENTSS